MKVLFTFGGLPHYLVSQLNSLNATEGVEVVVVVPEKNGKTIGKGVKQTDEGIQFKVIYAQEYVTYYKKVFFKNFKKILSQEKPDILVTLWPYILGLIFYPRIICFIKRKKIKLILKEIPFMVAPLHSPLQYYREHPVYDENLHAEKTSGLKFILKYLTLAFTKKIYYNLLDATVNYTDAAHEIQGSYGVSSKKIFIGYNSPDTDEIFKIKNEIINQPALLPANPHRLIHVGRLVKWKRVDILIKVVAQLKNKYNDIELLIIGTGPQEKELKELVLKLNIENNIKFIGGIYDYHLLGRYLLDSTIYVLAGMGGLSINEAMCFNKPVVCSVCDGTEKKLVRDGFNGYLFKDADENDLQNKIDLLFSNPALIKEMGDHSEKIILEEININTVVDGYLNAFHFVMK